MKNKIPIPPNGSRQQLLVRAINYFRSREGEPRLFTRRKLVLLAGQGCRSDRCAGRIVLGCAHLHHRPGGKADGCSGKTD